MTPEDIEKVTEAVTKKVHAFLILNTEDGQRVLDDLASFCHYNKTTQTRGDSHETSFNEGKRATYLYLLSRLRFAQSPEHLAQILKSQFEALERAEEDADVPE